MTDRLEKAREALFKAAKEWRYHVGTEQALCDAIEKLETIEAEAADPVRAFVRMAREAADRMGHGSDDWMNALAAAERKLGMERKP